VGGGEAAKEETHVVEFSSKNILSLLTSLSVPVPVDYKCG
jgi:hypothetical protein